MVVGEETVSQEDVEEGTEPLEHIVHGDVEAIETQEGEGTTGDVAHTGQQQRIACTYKVNT